MFLSTSSIFTFNNLYGLLLLIFEIRFGSYDCLCLFLYFRVFPCYTYYSFRILNFTPIFFCYISNLHIIFSVFRHVPYGYNIIRVHRYYYGINIAGLKLPSTRTFSNVLTESDSRFCVQSCFVVLCECFCYFSYLITGFSLKMGHICCLFI